MCVCLSVFYLSFTYLLLISFSLTSFHFHYLSGVIPLAPVPCGVFWEVGLRGKIGPASSTHYFGGGFELHWIGEAADGFDFDGDVVAGL